MYNSANGNDQFGALELRENFPTQSLLCFSLVCENSNETRYGRWKSYPLFHIQNELSSGNGSLKSLCVWHVLLTNTGSTMGVMLLKKLSPSFVLYSLPFEKKWTPFTCFIFLWYKKIRTEARSWIFNFPFVCECFLLHEFLYWLCTVEFQNCTVNTLITSNASKIQILLNFKITLNSY